MLLDVSNALKNPGQAYLFQCAVELPPLEVLDDPIAFQDIILRGEYTGSGESIAIEGAIDAIVHTRCALCLETMVQPIHALVHEIFTSELDPSDPDRYPLDAGKIELTPLVQDALLLELPMRFVCNEDCRGLCPTCGVNRNKERCTCQEGGERQNPFSALSELLIEDEEV